MPYLGLQMIQMELLYQKEVSTNLGSAIININGTITYTPDRNEYGKDMITMVVKR